MTLSTTTSRIQYTGNAATTAFAFPYRFLANGDLTVTITTPAGATTTQVLGTDYTVVGAGLDAGGTVTMTVAPASGELLTIRRVLDLTQEVDYQSGDPFPAETHEQALDRLTMITQQLDEALTRTLTLPPESNADASAIDVEAVEVVAGIAADVSAVAAIDDEIVAVDANSANVTTVAGVAASIPAVAAVASDIPTVAAVDGEIVTVAGIAANVTTVAGVSANVTTVATNIASINTAAANIAAIIDAPTQATAAAASALAADGSADAAAVSAAAAAASASASKQHGECRLALDGSNLRLSRYNGSALIINGTVQSIPSAGVALAPTSLSASTTYYIYAYMAGATMTLEASTTAYATHTDGITIKSGDATRTLVGMARTTAGVAWVDSGAQRLVLSWFNRRGKAANNATIVGGSTTSASFVEINTADRLQFLTWADASVRAGGTLSTLSSSSGVTWAVAIGLDGTVNTLGFCNFSGGTAVVLTTLSPAWAFETTEGFHFTTPLARNSGGATLTIQGGGTSTVHLEIQG